MTLTVDPVPENGSVGTRARVNIRVKFAVANGPQSNGQMDRR